MGCTSCTKSGGCEENKAPQRDLLGRVMASIYPDRTWGRPDDQARFLAGLRSTEVKRLGRALSVAARAPTFYRPGGPDDLCDFVYVQCLGRSPALVDARDGLGVAELVPEEERVRDRYLRVAFSSVARIAAVQEVAMELECSGADRILSEMPQPGVYDPQLLRRMRSIVDLIEANDIEHVDFGLVDVPATDMDTGEYRARYGVEPALANFLFYAQPVRISSVTMV